MKSDQPPPVENSGHLTPDQDFYFSSGDEGLIAKAEQQLWLEEHRKAITRLLSLQEGESFIDIGCGEGYHTIPLAQVASQNTGLDSSFNALQVMKSQPSFESLNLLPVLGTASRLPFRSMSMDKVLCNHVLEHVPDDTLVLQEMFRVLRPGGWAVIGVPIALSPQVQYAIRLRRLIFPNATKLQLEKVSPGKLVPELVGVQSHIRFYSYEAIATLFENHGFNIRRAVGIGFSANYPLRNFIRRHRLLFRLSNIIGRIFPAGSDGVLFLLERIEG